MTAAGVPRLGFVATFVFAEDKKRYLEYFPDDVINIFCTGAKYTQPLGEGRRLELAAQFTDQRSTGDELLTGSSFSTNQWGVRADWSAVPATLTLGFTDTASGADLRNPWSGHPGYTSAQVQKFHRAGEAAVL